MVDESFVTGLRPGALRAHPARRRPRSFAPSALQAPIRRVAMISLHTSPLDQPGTGDAGGLNVYVTELAKQLADHAIEVDIFTRATSSALPPVVELCDGVNVRHVQAGPFDGLDKDDLPAQLCTFSREVLRAEAMHDVGHYDVVHSHYWLSGQVGALAADRWGVPLVHSMHTMAKVKNELLAEGDAPEPQTRVIGEEQVVAAADMLVANTDDEARDLVRCYDADPAAIEVVHPGVDLRVFSPGDQLQARRALGIDPADDLLLFVGRLQPLKAPDILIRAVAAILRDQPERRRRLTVAIVGGPSGRSQEHPDSLAILAAELGVADIVRFSPPASRAELALWYRAATAVCVPSHNESFGLVAIEAQACGAPVVAASVGGLTTAVADGVSGLLVPGHDPEQYALALGALLDRSPLRQRLALGARAHARRFGWESTAEATVAAYRRAGSRTGLSVVVNR